MSVTTTPQAEKRAAHERLRTIQHARAAKAKADARRRAAVIRKSSRAHARRTATARSRPTAGSRI